MSKLQVRFTFDDDLMKENNIRRGDVYYTLKKNYAAKGIKCVSDDDVLMFEGTGQEDDYGCIWSVLMSLIMGDWFVKCVSSCDYIEDDYIEDVYSQIPEVREELAGIQLQG